MAEHEFVTVRNRRWCLGCGLFQVKANKTAIFPSPSKPCPGDTQTINYTSDTFTGKLSSEAPTVALRWRNGVLQQGWKILEYEGGRISAQRTEWRDVPTVTE